MQLVTKMIEVSDYIFKTNMLAVMTLIDIPHTNAQLIKQCEINLLLFFGFLISGHESMRKM
jgi:hypothetical protein